jgi:hypothetical protein
MTLDDSRTVDLVGRAEALLDRVESMPDPDARTDAVELVRALVALYGEGLARVTAAALRAGGDTVAAQFAADHLVSHLLLLHGLHPLDLPTRVAAAVEATCARQGEVRPELVSVDDDVVRLRLPAATAGCGSSTAALAAALTESIRAAAPEIDRVEVDQPKPAPAVIPVASLWHGPVGSRSAAAGG